MLEFIGGIFWWCFGWAMFSVLVAVALGLFGIITGSDIWYDLSWTVKIPILLAVGLCFWIPYWKKME